MAPVPPASNAAEHRRFGTARAALEAESRPRRALAHSNRRRPRSPRIPFDLPSPRRSSSRLPPRTRPGGQNERSGGSVLRASFRFASGRARGRSRREPLTVNFALKAQLCFGLLGWLLVRHDLLPLSGRRLFLLRVAPHRAPRIGRE